MSNNHWQESSSKYLGKLHSSLLQVQPQREEMRDHSLLRSESESSWEIPHEGGGLALNISFQTGSVHSSAPRSLRLWLYVMLLPAAPILSLHSPL